MISLKDLKGPKTQNLRDHMSEAELSQRFIPFLRDNNRRARFFTS